MTRLDGAGVHRPDGNLMYPISFDLDKGVRFGYDGKLSIAVKVAPKWECVFWPSTVTHPSAMIRLHALDAKQIEDCAFHSQSAREELSKARISRLSSALHLVPDDGNPIGLEVSGIHAISAIPITIISSPER